MSQTDHSFLSGLSLQPLHSSANTAISPMAENPEKELQRKVVKYEKEFNINVSRLEKREKQMKSSMLEYSQRMNSIRTRRSDPEFYQNDLQVRAKHIPRKRTLPKLSQNERLNKELNLTLSNPEAVPRRHNLKPLPVSRVTPNKDSVKLNFVDASDLCEMIQNNRVLHTKSVKFALKETPPDASESHRDSVNVEQIKVEITSKSKIDKSNETVHKLSETPPVDTSVRKTKSGINFRSEETLKLVQNALQKLQEIEIKRKHSRSLLQLPRNSRTKRLKFPQTDLSAIPEDDQAESMRESPDTTTKDKTNYLPSFPALVKTPRSRSKFNTGLSDIPEVEITNKLTSRTYKSLPPIPLSQNNQDRLNTNKYIKERKKKLRNITEQ